MESETVIKLYSQLNRLKELNQEKDEIIDGLFEYVKDLEIENTLLHEELERREY